MAFASAWVGLAACGSHNAGVTGSVGSGGAVGGGVGGVGARGGGESGTGGAATGGGDGGGCLSEASAPCGPGLTCQRSGSGECVDPSWAEWPMPNADVEVTAGAPNPQSYTDNHDGTATDDVTQLMWQQLAPLGAYTQPEAAAYCAGLALGGYHDWRLPQVIELVSIVDTGTYNPSIDSSIFPGTSAEGFYWSSTPYVGLPDNMWGVYFNNGYSAYNPSAWAKSVRCVR